ncbi:MAG: hypothetical protein ACLSAO_09315 [Anaerovoracaceae bacterium]
MGNSANNICVICGASLGKSGYELLDGNYICKTCYKEAGYGLFSSVSKKTTEEVRADMEAQRNKAVQQQQMEEMRRARVEELQNIKKFVDQYDLDAQNYTTEYLEELKLISTGVIANHLKNYNFNGMYSNDPVENLKISLEVIKMEQNNIMIRQNEELLRKGEAILDKLYDINRRI